MASDPSRTHPRSPSAHEAHVVNRAHWDAVAALHTGDEEFRARLRAHGTTLHPIELAELSPRVAGKSLLHLQCHTGMDTMSWVKKGAGPVVGIDFSPKAIEAARALSRELGIETEFVECDVYDAADRLQRTFDVVFSSYGVLCWLGDLRRWADNVARLVAPGGLFYLVEFHPFVWALADDATADRPAMGYAYLSHQVPKYFASGTDYIDSSVTTPPHYTWNHGLGPMITAILERGLVLEFLHEMPYCATAIVPMLKVRSDGYYEIPGTDAFPLSFSLLARRPR